MGVTGIVLATEDELSEAVGVRLVEVAAPHWRIDLPLRKGGFGYLRSRIGSFCDMARRQPVLVLTDLDQRHCATALIQDWMGARHRPDALLLRVVVRTIESWLVGDHDAMRSLLGRRALRLPDTPESLPHPKQYLIDLARRSPRPIRESLVPEPGSTATQGLGYNTILTEFVRREWQPERAATRCDSLHRTLARMRRVSDAA